MKIVQEFFDLNSITGKINDISIKKGNLLIQRQPNIKIEGEVFSEANLDEKKLRDIIKEIDVEHTRKSIDKYRYK